MFKVIEIKSVVPIVALFLSICFGCNPELDVNPVKENFEYIFLGHTYQTNTTIDERLEDLDSDYYDQIWLGGDICAETTYEYETLNYLDAIFDLSNLKTHWTLGNHDIRQGNVQWITEKTQKPTFYTTSFNGISLLVLNTNFGHGGVYDTLQLNEQFELIQSVCDTIQESSHLIILSHAVAWRGVDELEHVVDASNAEFSYMRFHISPDKRFADGIYPMLQQVANRGIQVINIAGDFGQKQTQFEAMTEDGIYFLGSGITSETGWNEQFPSYGKPDKILLLHHNTSTQKITWDFVEI